MAEDSGSGGRKTEVAFEDASLWISRILAMIAPGLVGLWLDDKFGTRYLAATGFVMGIVYAVTMFRQLSRDFARSSAKRPAGGSPPEQRDPS